MTATYKFYYYTKENNIENQKEYISSYNILQVRPYFLTDTSNVTEIYRIDILADPDGLNTDEALGYN
jgi:hypothetical protein